MSFKVFFPSSVKNSVAVSLGIDLSLHIAFGETAIFTILNMRGLLIS